MTFVAVATMSELGDRRPLAIEIGDQQIALIADGDEIFAIADECTHGKVPLSDGDVLDCSIECYLHGGRFDLRTGRPLSPPVTHPVAVFPVRVDGTDILVDLDRPIDFSAEAK